MSRNNRLKVVLFALTGFGNTVLESLLEDDRVNVGAVFTVKYDRPFPYYQEQQLMELCRQRQISCYHDVKVNSDEGIDLLKKHSPDLIIVATFKQILKERILGLPSLGVVNVHPSLLPKYRGACPTNAVLDNDEKVTGVTFHYVTEELDNGDILLQRALPISETDNDGQLRQKLAQLAGRLIPELVGMFSGFSKPAGTPQDHALASFAPKPVVEDGYLEKAKDIQTIRKKIRAFNPIPGTSILVADQRIPINRFEIVQDSKPDGIYVNRDTIEWIIGPEAIRLFKNLEFQSS